MCFFKSGCTCGLTILWYCNAVFFFCSHAMTSASVQNANNFIGELNTTQLGASVTIHLTMELQPKGFCELIELNTIARAWDRALVKGGLEEPKNPTGSACGMPWATALCRWLRKLEKNLEIWLLFKFATASLSMSLLATWDSLWLALALIMASRPLVASAVYGLEPEVELFPDTILR